MIRARAREDEAERTTTGKRQQENANTEWGPETGVYEGYETDDDEGSCPA